MCEHDGKGPVLFYFLFIYFSINRFFVFWVIQGIVENCVPGDAGGREVESKEQRGKSKRNLVA